MGLFSRATQGADMRDRDYVLTGCPVVAQDEMVVLVDLTVRLVVRPPRDGDSSALGYSAAEETAVHAVCVLVLRQLGAEMPSGELLAGRMRVAEAVEKGLGFAPVGAGIDGRVHRVEVRPHDPGGVYHHEFRIAGSV